MLPSNEYTFTLKVKGDKTKSSYEGPFTVKCLLSNGELIDVGLRIDAYNRGSTTVPQGIALLNRALAELEVRIIKAPSWWKDSNSGRDLLDTNVIYEVFEKSLDAEKVYDERIAEQVKKDEAVAEESSKKGK